MCIRDRARTGLSEKSERSVLRKQYNKAYKTRLNRVRDNKPTEKKNATLKSNKPVVFVVSADALR